MAQYLNLIRPDFSYRPSFCVMWLWTWQKRHLRSVDRQSCISMG